MAYANLSNGMTNVIGGSNICLVDNFQSIRGGRTLDVTGYAPTSIKEGHLVIVETATGTHKPMPVSGTAYAALPAGHTYAGVVVSDTPTSSPFVGVCVRGTVNHLAAPYTMTSVLAAVRTALPLIDFRQD